jgi:hypothetical protein
MGDEKPETTKLERQEIEFRLRGRERFLRTLIGFLREITETLNPRRRILFV